MKFRPCIDIHNGQVKQIVGGSLKDIGDGNGPSHAAENFVASLDASYYAELYRENQLTGGHIILLNPKGTPEYEADLAQAKLALDAYPGGMQIGGGINETNAKDFISMGASHVIVTSAIFQGGELDWDRLKKIVETVGREHLVLDLSCRKKDGAYYIVTNRWQTFTDFTVNEELMNTLSEYCDEFLIHGVDSEGLGAGFEGELIEILSTHSARPITYAGGISTLENLEELYTLSKGRLDFTIGSALDLFGGKLAFSDVVKFANEKGL